MVGNMEFKMDNIPLAGISENEALEQPPEFQVEQIKKSITGSLDRIGLLKNIHGAEFEKKEIWRTVGILTKQLRELEEALGIKQDFKVNEE